MKRNGTPRKIAQAAGDCAAAEAARRLPRVRYSEELAARIVELVADGVPIADATIGGERISPGIASRLGVSSAAIFAWQQQYPDFAERIARAREEAAHRIADRMLALADLALKQPELANAIRVAADILRWQAAVRNPRAYAEQRPREPAAITVVLGIERPRVEQEAIPPALPDGDPSR